MKKVCIITLSFHSDHFESEFPIEKDTPEYILADEAWRLAILFAQTQAFAHSISVPQVLEELDYEYTITERKCD